MISFNPIPTTLVFFLGYSQTMTNILYLDLVSNQVKTALYVVFDKAMADADVKSLNAHLLCGDVVLPSEVLNLSLDLTHLDVSLSPFTSFVTLDMPFAAEDLFPFGIDVASCSRLHCAYVTFFLRAPLDCPLGVVHCSLLGSYVISIADIPVSNVGDLSVILQCLCSLDSFPSHSVVLVLAPEWQSSFDDCPSSVHLQLHDLHHLSALWSIMRERLTTTVFIAALSHYEASTLVVAKSCQINGRIKHLNHVNLSRLLS